MIENFKIKSVELVHETPRDGMGSYTPLYDESIIISSEDGREVQLNLYGDCCSQSFFEEHGVKEVKALVGFMLLGVQPVQSGELSQGAILRMSEVEAGLVRYHAVDIITSAGTTVLDWRNESNGYYDGVLDIVLP